MKENRRVYLVLIFGIVVSLFLGCTSKNTEELCKQRINEEFTKNQEFSEIIYTFEVLTSGTFQDFDEAAMFMSENHVKEEYIKRTKDDFVSGGQPVVIVKVESTFLGTNVRFFYGLVCNDEGEIQPASMRIITEY